MSAAGGKGGFPQAPSIGGGPAPAQPAQQPDIYARRGGLPNVDSDPFTEGYQPPGTTPAQQPQQQPPSQIGTPGGKSGPGGKGGMPGGPSIGMPVERQPFDPNQPNPLGPEGQQPVMTEPPLRPGIDLPSPGGKSGMPFTMQGTGKTVQLSPEQLQAIQSQVGQPTMF